MVFMFEMGDLHLQSCSYMFLNLVTVEHYPTVEAGSGNAPVGNAPVVAEMVHSVIYGELQGEQTTVPEH